MGFFLICSLPTVNRGVVQLTGLPWPSLYFLMIPFKPSFLTAYASCPLTRNSERAFCLFSSRCSFDVAGRSSNFMHSCNCPVSGPPTAPGYKIELETSSPASRQM